ncbi:MAG TPA: amidohydrolase family protein [Acidimicrobiales bacterium]|nr:amidohydrolase family protein [Acidimicrobiales bacterium]
MASVPSPLDPDQDDVDLLITNGRVVTMDPERRIFVGGAVAIAGTLIRAVGATSQLRRTWPGAPALDAAGGFVTPGLVNAHQHLTGDPLAWSCIPDNLIPGSSIFDWSIPLHASEGPEDERLAATLVAAESARNGVTMLVEAGTLSHPHAVAAALTDVGVRGTIGMWGWDIEAGPLTAPAPEALGRLESLLGDFPAGGQVEAWVTLVGHSLASDELLAGAADLARRAGAKMTMHLSPTSSDPEVYLQRTGRRPIVHLERLGVLGPHLLLAHAVWIDDAEMEALLASRTAVAYCPWAYLRLGQGVTAHGRHPELYARGGRVALGCDATNASDAVDLLRAAALAAGLAKERHIDPTQFGAHEAFEMATVAGAEAVGMGDRIGSLEAGKLADIVIHSPSVAHWSSDPALALVWGTDGRTVRHVFVGGRQIVRDGRCVTVDHDEVLARARAASESLLARAGITVPTRWPIVAGD